MPRLSFSLSAADQRERNFALEVHSQQIDSWLVFLLSSFNASLIWVQKRQLNALGLCFCAKKLLIYFFRELFELLCMQTEDSFISKAGNSTEIVMY